MFCIWLLFLPLISQAYLYGDESVIWCWRTPLATGIKEMLSSCPAGIATDWINPVPQELYERTEYDVSYRVSVPLDYNLTTSPHISHTNLHSCTVSTGACTPNVAETPGLVTHTGAQSSETIQGDALTADYSHVLELDVGEWTIIAHSRFQVDGEFQYDIAIGTTREVLRITSEIEVADGAKIAMFVLAGLVMALEMAVYIYGHMNQTSQVIKAASWPFCQGIILSGIVGNAAVFLLAEASPATCGILPWLLILMFDGMIGLLVIKTNRIKNIFLKKTLKAGGGTTNQDIAKQWAMTIVAPDVVLLLVWSVLARMEPTNAFDTAGDWVVVCDSDLGGIFSSLALVMKAILLASALYLATITWDVNPQFNESRLIAATLYTTTIVTGFGLPLSYTMEGQPTELFVLRSAVILVTTLATLGILFFPKFYMILTIDSEDFQNDASKSARQRSSVDKRGKPKVSIKGGKLSSVAVESIKKVASQGNSLLKRQMVGLKLKPSSVLKFREEVVTLKDHLDNLVNNLRSSTKGGHKRSNSTIDLLKTARHVRKSSVEMSPKLTPMAEGNENKETESSPPVELESATASGEAGKAAAKLSAAEGDKATEASTTSGEAGEAATEGEVATDNV